MLLLVFGLVFLIESVFWVHDLQAGTPYHFVPEVVGFFIFGLLARAYQVSLEFGVIWIGAYLFLSITFFYAIFSQVNLLTFAFLIPFLIGYEFGVDGGDLFE